MKKHLASLIILFAFLITFSACKKDDEPKLSAKTIMLSAKPWKFQSATALGQDVLALGLGEYLGALSTIEYKFNTDGTYITTNRSNNATAEGKWEFASNETQIITDKGTANERIYEIITLSNTNLDLRWSVDKNSIPTALVPENLRPFLIFAPANIPVDLKLIPVQ